MSSPTSEATRAERAALRALQFGALAVVLAALPFKPFDLDRFFVAKELVLHLTAAAVAVLLWRAPRRLVVTPPDVALTLFLVASAASAALATNWWLAFRALAISVSGATLFWGARCVARAGLARPLVAALAIAAAVAALTSLLQAYGVETEYFSLNRAPGGTFGNRNFVAHLGAVGLPLLVCYALTARGAGGAVLGALGAGVTAAALVLSRSRGAWLAVAATAVPAMYALWRVRRLRTERSRAGRRLLLAVAAAAGVGAALVLPNTLEWKSDSPYLDSVRGVVDYRQGSGAGRLVQYRNTLRMAIAHPAVGVGPGNWPVWYPRYASPGDPSLAEDAMTANPWPSSDWAAFVAERGLIAALLLALVFLAGLTRAVRGVRRATRAEELIAPATLGAVLVSALVVGAFDAVMLLAAPAFVVWTAVGALWPEDAAVAAAAEPDADASRASSRGTSRGTPVGERAWRGGAALLTLVALLFAARSATQMLSMAIVGTDVRAGALGWASIVDPGSYRVHLWLARSAASHARCGPVKSHAGAANALYPSAPEPRRLLARCGVTVARPRTWPGR